jgi:uncharacterized protein (TIGR03118 family)
MNRRQFMQRSLHIGMGSVVLGSSASLLTACGGGSAGTGDVVSATNRFKQTNLVASAARFNPLILEPRMIDAWGIANRPAGAGGHFWVTASEFSFEYVGDVNGTPLHQDGFKEITLPPSGDNIGAANGTVFNRGTNFVITQAHPNGPITAPAKFLFVSDNGVLSAWTERLNADGSFDRSGTGVTIVDDGAAGSSFFGLAMSPLFDEIFVLDFGVNPIPRIRVFNGTFQEQPVGNRFRNPFLGAGGFRIGDLVPFNIQTISYNNTSSIFIAYVNTQDDPDNPGHLLAATESSGRGRGRLVEYAPNGDLIAIWDDRGVLNGPWGIVLAPADFGTFSNQLLVGNFSDGKIVGFDTITRRVTEYLRDDKGDILVIQGLWDMLVGNGQSLGDSNAVYFAAGPGDETEGLFGSLRVAK